MYVPEPEVKVWTVGVTKEMSLGEMAETLHVPAVTFATPVEAEVSIPVPPRAAAI